MSTFNILIASIGRDELQKMINSLAPQLTEMDCLTIVFDGHERPPIFDYSQLKCTIITYCEPIALGYWGHAIRNKYADILEPCDFILHADDDNYYTDCAFEYLRSKCIEKDKIYIALMYVDEIKRCIGYAVEENAIGTPCGIIPYEYNQHAIWRHKYGGDGLFYQELSSYYQDKIVLLDFIIYYV